jgi:aldose 1-epimerase
VGTAHLFPPASRFSGGRPRRVVAGTTAAVIAVALGVTPAVASGHAKHRHGHGPSVTSEPWGSTTEGNVERWTLNNGHRMTVKILTYGGIIQSLYVPDRSGHLGNVALGFDNLPDYVAKSPYFGCITGRYANRIALGQFSIDGNDYQLPINNDPNSLHGGTVGFDKHIWATTPFKHGSSVGLVMKFTSPDGDQGYPGTMNAQVTYTLTKNDTLKMNYQATTDKPTIVNLTNHNYWNLAGEGSGDIYGHKLFLNSKEYTPVDPTLIPTGSLDPVAGTPMDFRHATAIGDRIRDGFPQLVIGRGYDHNWVLDRGSNTSSNFVAAKVTEPTSGRVLTIRTDQPGIQFYSGNFLDGTLTGKAGAVYKHRTGFCLETQHFPDSPNHPQFPSAILRPGATYRSRTVFTFGVAP